MIKVSTRIATVGALALIAASCQPSSNLNVPCLLVKKNPNDPTGQSSTPIKEADIKSNAARDVISFGATECEDLVCIREGGAALSGNDTTDVGGWCSRPCLESSTNACPSNDPSLDKNPTTALSCRKLLLDEAAMAALKQNDPVTFKRVFGDTQSPFFCARAPVAPATNP